MSGISAMKAVMKYPGSKWSLANWIINFFPEHHSYLEPFLGSGAVLFNKPRSNIETVNDLDGNVVNLFEWIRKDPERLAHEIYYTPYARRVTDVRVERLQKITDEQAEKEGCLGYRTEGKFVVSPTLHFMGTWDATVKKGDIGRYGWKANPWVWAIGFEVMDVE